MKNIELPHKPCVLRNECGIYKSENFTCNYGPHDYCGRYRELMYKKYGIRL